MTPEQERQREKLRELMQERLREQEKQREVKLPIGFHMNGIPIYAGDDNGQLDYNYLPGGNPESDDRPG